MLLRTKILWKIRDLKSLFLCYSQLMKNNSQIFNLPKVPVYWLVLKVTRKQGPKESNWRTSRQWDTKLQWRSTQSNHCKLWAPNIKRDKVPNPKHNNRRIKAIQRNQDFRLTNHRLRRNQIDLKVTKTDPALSLSLSWQWTPTHTKWNNGIRRHQLRGFHYESSTLTRPR